MIIVNQLPQRLAWLCPAEIQDPIRLGDAMDGGYVIPQVILDSSQALLSLGLGDNWSFDQDWSQHHADHPIHVYDGTVSEETLAKTINVPYRHDVDLKAWYKEFFQEPHRHWRENVGNKSHQTALGTCLDRLGRDLVFVKMDIEGGEYPMIADILAHSDRITGLVMEFHWCNGRRQLFQDSVEALKSRYVLVHLHGNNHTGQGAEGLTDCLELTWVRRDLAPNLQPRPNFYLPGLDFSNRAGLEDQRYCF